MPYLGDRQEPEHPKFTTDFGYVKKLPGALILVQLVCTGLGFLLALGGSLVWMVKSGHGFYTFVSFVSFLSCVCWLVVHVFQFYTLFKIAINWNLVGLVYNGVNGFLMMVASCVMVEVASEARALKAAGVFGFLAFTGFLAALVWEALLWHKNRDSGAGFSSASVVRGLDRPDTPESDCVDVRGVVAGGDDHDDDAAVGLVGMKARPVSSFMQPAHNGEVSTPMLYAPGWEKDKDSQPGASDDFDSDRSEGSSHSSVQGEWQTPS
ncbi:uncharacterized protein [Procambarus clarkii]|uniref:uncharacterized protein isoform X2 n=1 Tax=Procambarus clarkii TaxID=6728 RepID=UPI001E675260|nr:uncharacterized protein LOC123766395 isoform X2 [Procambarus clarkii]